MASSAAPVANAAVVAKPTFDSLCLGRSAQSVEASTVTAGSGRALGFGFIVFANPSVAERMVMEKHIIDGRRLHRSRYPSGATEVFLQTGEQSGGSNQAPFWMSKLENQQQLLATPLMGGKRAIGEPMNCGGDQA
ncbi:hypothetical protein HID58_043335 [Brassica napus]|uniref:RRM domain-containing protein n=1 Tax=Brassica napus TaxID=3708 RepID=A0ABQ8BHA3_BRANA|nr:hypothetical protein HID58_043335 [Brassica napus]